MPVDHIVVPGGGPHGIRYLATLLRLRDLGYWELKDIRSMYGTSAGALMSVVLCLDFETKTLHDYFILRPWHAAFKKDVGSPADVILGQGADPLKIIRTVLAPLLAAKDMSVDITLAEFYAQTRIDLNMVTTKVQPGQAIAMVVMNHESHPTLRVIEACARSSALFPFIKCVCDKDCFYIDGAMGTASAISLSMEKYPYPARTLSVSRVSQQDGVISENLNSMNTFLLILESALKSMQIAHEHPVIEHEFIAELPFATPFSLWFEACTELSTRSTMFDLGKRDAQLGLARRLMKKLVQTR